MRTKLDNAKFRMSEMRNTAKCGVQNVNLLNNAVADGHPYRRRSARSIANALPPTSNGSATVPYAHGGTND